MPRFCLFSHAVVNYIFECGIETLICLTEMSSIGFAAFDFAQNTIHDFQNIVLNSKWQCLRQMPLKRNKVNSTV